LPDISRLESNKINLPARRSLRSIKRIRPLVQIGKYEVSNIFDVKKIEKYFDVGAFARMSS